MLQYFELTG